MDKKGAFYEHKEFDLITFGETMLRLSPPVNELIYKSDSFKKHRGRTGVSDLLRGRPVGADAAGESAQDQPGKAGAAVGADDLTDAPNFGTKFGRRRPCPRYGGPNPRPSEKGRIPTSARWASSE